MDETFREEAPAGVAIVGMAGRFPGAAGVEAFWENLVAGVESVTFYGRGELLSAGVEPALIDDPAYVPARAAVAGAELFDAGLFGYSAREAEVMDPQHRLLLECAWEALDHAGCDPRRFPGLIGVYAGAGVNGYLWQSLSAHPGILESVGEFQTLLGNGGDFLATRLSYKLGLKGPSLTVQTACSTSLVAVHLAVQSLLNGECDLALAGGVRVAVPRPAGYLYQADGVLSPDGRCRPFDAAGRGTVDGEGAAIVVLKRLADALAEGDRVHAVILGTAVNNDGDQRVGFTAPGVEGQAAVVALAQAVAGVHPESIGFVEAHGTATPLGDPVEVAALSQVFAASTSRRGFCALGSVKGNVGHMDAAAGVVSLLKAALALEREVIPPTPGFAAPNPRLGLPESSFFVNAEPLPWPRAEAPRRAAVSSFGVGGTNAHAVLEEAPPVPPSAPAAPWQLLVLSAASAAALEAATDRLAAHLARHPGLPLADVAFTLQVGRQELAYRRALVCRDLAQAGEELAARGKRLLSGIAPAVGRPSGPPLVPAPPAGPEALESLAQSWLAGAAIDWPALHGPGRRKVILPSYPFEHQPYWIGRRRRDAPDPPSEPLRRPAVGPSPGEARTSGSPDEPTPESAPAPAPRKPRPLGTPYVEPRNDRERRLARLFEELLGYAPVGALDEFFEMGGHSVLGLQLLSRVKAELGAEVRLDWLFQASSVADLAGLLDILDEETGAATAAPEAFPRTPRGTDLPLSPAQERLWFLDRLDPGTPSLNLTEPVFLDGTLDVPALAGALAEVVRRHESLRTAFVEVGGRPAQRILPALQVPLPRVDLAALPPARREAEAVRLATRAGARRFDLSRPPLLAAELYRLAPDRHGLALVLHHIVGDGWSSVVLLSELAEIYGAFTAGRPSPLPELPLQYADYAVWQRGRLGEEEMARQIARWRERLAPLPPPLELPTDRPRKPARAGRGASQILVLPPAEGTALRALAAGHGATPFMVLLAGFALLLSRWSGQDDLVVGAPIAGRDRRELEGLIGVFLNLLPLRLDLAGDPPFAALVDRVREVAVAAYAGQEVPVERLITELAPARDLSRPPLFQVLFNLQAFPGRARGVPGLALEPLPLLEVPARFDATVYAEELESGGIHLDLVYDADLFDRATMTGFLAQLGRLLARAASAPETPLSRLSLLTPEASSVLPDPRAPLGASAMGESVHERFFARARRHPERPAVIDPTGTWTYGELAARAGGVAGRLRLAGIGRGDVVAVYAARRAPLVQALLGVLAAGAAFLLLDPAHPAPRLRAALRQARPRAWIEASVPGVSGELAEALPTLAFRTDESPEETRPETETPVSAGPADLAYVAFTSGSTGEPKGILGPHAPLAHFCVWQAATFGLGKDDRVSLLSGLAHDPLLRDVFTPLTLGAAVCIPDPDDLGSPSRLGAWMARSRVTVCHLTPAFGRLLAEGGIPLPALRHVFFGGDVLHERDVARLRTLAPAAAVTNFYGTTETPQAVAWFDASNLGDQPARPVPVGRGIDGVDLLVWNEAGELAAPGELGEVVVRSPYLSLGYLGDGGLTARRFGAHPGTGDTADRVYRTGDLGRYRTDGAVVLAGRRDDQLQVRGFRVEPAEVEAALRGHPAVRQVAVRGRAAGGRAVLTAWLVAAEPTPDILPRAAELRDFLVRHLPEPMLPEAWVWVERLPLTPNGKLDRRALPEPEQGTAEPAFEPPANPLEEEVAAVWCELLALERVGRHDNFFELGGHSLLAVRVVGEIGDRLGVELPLRSLFGTPTVAAVAAAVAEAWVERDGEEVVRLLEDLDDLSEEGAETLLAAGEEGSLR